MRIGQLVFYARTVGDTPYGPGGGLYDFRPLGCMTRTGGDVPGRHVAPARPAAIPEWVEASVVEALGLPPITGVIAWGRVCGEDFGFVRLDTHAAGTVYAVWRPDVVPQ